MRIFTCSCGNRLYFDNSRCVNCGHDVGWCPSCRQISDVEPRQPAGYQCVSCHAALVKCGNAVAYGVCNRFVLEPVVKSAMQGQVPKPDPQAPAIPVVLLCDCCRFNKTIPDLKVQGNAEKWRRLEAAKRRSLYNLWQVGFRFGNERDGVTPPLAFEFKAEAQTTHVYKDMGTGEKVYTGHADGRITINIREADDVEREKLRVEMHEAQRSLLGHFRHEMGHYIWDEYVKGGGQREAACIEVFGDHDSPTYADALQAYYANGPKANWVGNYVSAYATMHPWEDFAETFAVYLDMTAALETAYHNGLIAELHLDDLDWMCERYLKLGIALNEMNRSNGLLDYLPEVIAEPVKGKLAFIHGLTKVDPTAGRVEEKAEQPELAGVQ